MNFAQKKLMKIVAGILLVASMTMTLASCSLWKKDDESDSESGNGGLIFNGGETESDSESETESEPETESETESETETEAPVTLAQVDEDVWTTASLNLRTSPSGASNDNIYKAVPAGTKLHRTAVSENWSRVEYDGKELYAVTRYLSTTEPTAPTELTFTDVEDEVYVNAESQLNLRDKPSTQTGAIKVVANRGDLLTRTGVATDADGTEWSRILYKAADGSEMTLYASSKYLSTEKPAEKTKG